ncbi:unnamed protein product, partial [marine sediment metagenome]
GLNQSYIDLAGDAMKCCSSDLTRDPELKKCIKKQPRL